MSRFSLRRLIGASAVAIMAAAGLTACGGTAVPSTAQCAMEVGDGQNRNDNNVHGDPIYPGQTREFGDGRTAKYFPCGPRNYIINDGTVLNANGDKVGDRFTPTQVWTQEKPGQPRVLVNIWTMAFWTPNQGHLKEFFQLCYKYHCYTDNASEGADKNFSTKGWNGMLGENFGGNIDLSAQYAFVGPEAAKTDDLPALKNVKTVSFSSNDIRNVVKWAELGNAMSANFQQLARSSTGFSDDLFCASGSGGWKNPNDPGKGEFTCNNVRIQVVRVERADPEARAAEAKAGLIDAQKDADAKRVAQAQQLYGPKWATVLGIQDIIDHCNQANQAAAGQGKDAKNQPTDKQTVCQVNIGNGLLTVPNVN